MKSPKPARDVSQDINPHMIAPLRKIKGFRKSIMPVMLAIGILFLIWLVYKTGLTTILTALTHLNPFYIVLAIIARYAASFTMAFRLKNLMRTNLGIFRIFKISVMSVIFNFSSMVHGFGSLVKIGLLKKEKVGFVRSGAAITSEIGYKMLNALLILAIFFAYQFKEVSAIFTKNSNLVLLLLIPIIVLAVVVTLFLLRKNIHVQRYIRNILINLSLANFVKNLFLTFAAAVFNSLAMVLVFKAMGYDISLIIALFGGAISYLVASVSFIPSGLGIRETTRAYVYTISGLPLAVTGTASVLSMVIMIPALIVLALFLNFTDRKSEK